MERKPTKQEREREREREGGEIERRRRKVGEKQKGRLREREGKRGRTKKTYRETGFLYMQVSKKCSYTICSYRWVQRSIKRPTSGGLMRNQEAAVQRTFHNERSSF